MIRFNSLAIRFGQAWFDEPVTLPMPDIVVLRHSSVRPTAGLVSLKKSLVNDLTVPDDEIFAKIGKTCRYKIKRAETKDLALCRYQTAPSVEEVDSFLHFYAQFARQKGLSPINRKQFLAVARAGRLRLAEASLQGAVVVRHAYIVSGDTARLLYSASLFRDTDPEVRSAIGRANRLLHWRDLLAFKQEGLRVFDWGGIFADETSADRKGINDFKREFGGEPATYYDGYEAHSLLGQLILALLPAARGAKAFLATLRAGPTAPASQPS
jgi:lipid II:glycine glycyltransferase (peptidoglycan interpeptide bridge formation enzyme)